MTGVRAALARHMRGLAGFATSMLASSSMVAVAAATRGSDGATRPSDLGHFDHEITFKVESLLSRMTPEEKAGQLAQFFYFSALPDQNARIDALIEKGQVSSIINVWDPSKINRAQRIARRSRLGIPLLVGGDVVHGLRTIFPAPIGLAASWDPVMVERLQAIAAAEARAIGINWTFAPMVDIARDPRWGRIFEGAGEDPFLGAAMAAAQVRGFQGPYLGAPGHVLAGPKHFAAYGAATGGRDYDQADVSDEQLWNTYLPPFKAAIDAGAGNLMAAYMPLNGIPATSNRWLLTDVLRRTWGFDGFVVSDAGSVRNLTTHGLTKDASSAAVAAVEAGVDMGMDMQPLDVMHHLGPAQRSGQISQEAVDEAVRRVLRMKFRLGLFEDPFVDEKAAERVLDDREHFEAARVAAERSAVLLMNEGGLLPLDRGKLRSIAVIGPLADAPRDMLGAWVFLDNKPKMSSILGSIKEKAGAGVRVEHAIGAVLPKRLHGSLFDNLERPPVAPDIDEGAEMTRAIDLARGADVSILVLGEGQIMSGEMASRSTLDLPGRQQELLDAVVALGKPVAVLLMSARPLNLRGATPAGVLCIWHPGSAGGPAIANLLFGDANPGGKLPFTAIRNAAHAPNYYGHLLSQEPKNADRRYWNETSAPTYPFGHGLSYTNFRYSNLRVDRPSVPLGENVGVTVDLTNIGSRPGDEVAQLYVHQRWGTSARPVRELKGFQRILLHPGETRTVHFTIKASDLRYWSSAPRNWVQDASAFKVWVGGSSAADLEGAFEVVGQHDQSVTRPPVSETGQTGSASTNHATIKGESL